MIVITADDYGKTIQATDSIFECFLNKRITSTSVMVFMEDSERAASLSKNSELEVGLHLNFIEPFNGFCVPPTVRKHQNEIVAYLKKNKFTQLIYNPLLTTSFHLVFHSQLEEFERLYGKLPDFYNGHHHMHLCANLLISTMIPKGARVRRTYTFNAGDKNIINLLYRNCLNRWISKRYISTDRFLSIVPVNDIKRLNNIINCAKKEDVEIEVHPENEEESKFLLSNQCKKLLNIVQCGGFRQLIKK